MRWVRLVLAWAITFGVLAYLGGLIAVFTMLSGKLIVRETIVFTLLIGFVAVLTWNVRPPGKTWGTLAVWAVVNAVLYGAYAAPRMPFAALLAIVVPSTIWVVWLAWIGSWPLRWPVRLRMLALWVTISVAGMAAIRVEGMTGDTRMVFAWRFGGDAMAAPAQPTDAAVTLDVTPTPDDFPQFLGPNRNGVVPEAKIGKLVERWRREVGTGWGSFAIVGGYAFTQEQRGESECVTCYRVADGVPQWTHADATRFAGLGGVGPGATPSVAGGRVYSVGATGLLNCLDAATGKPHWHVDLLRECNAKNLEHGACASPLVDGDRVIVCSTRRGGPSLLAFQAETGQLLWQAGDHTAGYSSPALAEIGGVPQIVLFDSNGVTGHARDKGSELWHFEWNPVSGVNASQPLVGVTGPDRVLISTGYGKGATLLRIVKGDGRWSAEAVCEGSKHLKTKFTTAVPHGAYVYGLDEGILTCFDPATKKQRWKDGRYGHGQILLAGDTLIVQAENGEVVLVAPSPEGLREVSRTPALTEKTWNNPALAGRFLLVRNDREAVCFDVLPP